MEEQIFKTIYIALLIIGMAGRIPFAIKIKKIKEVRTYKKLRESFVLMISSLVVLPALFYIFTDWLNDFNIGLPFWARIIGVIGFAFGIFLHNWTHIALGTNWSPTLEIKKNQKLVMCGPYKYMRHPMYSAFWLWVLFQGILLSNWLVFVLGVLSFGIVYFSRIKDEEKIMIEKFGNEYKEYMKHTGRLFPKL
ncbi:isoprenylcysteine carboxylmethyltransferase family protein [Candidatus Parcubacteria bacterium]|nr:isoprenylcysteine carboxylmethyltransferase family protein [Candidatus Parcubacteria bacterium]